MGKRFLVAVVIGAVVVGTGVTGCTQTANGSAKWIPGQASKIIDGSDAEGLLLDTDAVQNIMDADLVDVYSTSSPLDDADLENCEVFALTGQVALLGEDWDGFHVRTLDDQLDDDLNANYLAGEVAVVYSDAEAAKTSFEATRTLADGCDGKDRTTSAGHSWSSKIDVSSDDTLTWTDEQTDLGSGDEWRCSGDVRRRLNVVLRAYTCRGDQEGPANSAAIADKMANNVWELAGPGN